MAPNVCLCSFPAHSFGMGRVSLIACPPPAFLCFTSWWRENENGKSVRREVKLKASMVILAWPHKELS